MKKFKLIKSKKTFKGKPLFQVVALKDFSDVVKGEKGGYVEKEENLEQSENAWIRGDAVVSENAVVSGNAWISGDAAVRGCAVVSGNARIDGNIKLRSGWCFARKEKNWDISEVENEGVILLIRDYKPIQGEEHKIVIDGKEIESSEESFEELRKSLK